MQNTRMLQKLLQIEKVHIFPILIIGLSIISNVIGQSFFPFVNYPLYTSLRMGEQYHFYGVQQGEGEMVYLPFRHYFFYPFNYYRFHQTLFFKNNYCRDQDQREACLERVSRLLESQMRYINKKNVRRKTGLNLKVSSKY